MKGRTPTPTEVRLATGNPQHRPMAPVVVGAGKVLDVPVPDDLTELEQQVWAKLVPPLSEVGWIDGADVPHLVQWVQVMALCERLRGELNEQELTQTTKKRGRTANPLIRAYLAATAQALRLAEQYGFTPSARARLGLTTAAGMTLARELELRIGDDDQAPAISIEV